VTRPSTTTCRCCFSPNVHARVTVRQEEVRWWVPITIPQAAVNRCATARHSRVGTGCAGTSRGGA